MSTSEPHPSAPKGSHDDALRHLPDEPLTRVMAALGRPGGGAVLGALTDGPLTFGELRRILPGADDDVLVERLTEFAALGLVTRTATPGTPSRIDYRLTARGRSLQPALGELHRWAVSHLRPT